MNMNCLKGSQEHEAMLYWLNEHAESGVFTLDTGLNFQSWNHWLELHTGMSAAEIVGRNLLEIYPQLKERRFDRFYNQALNGQVVVLSQRLHGYLLPMAPTSGNNIFPYMLQSVRIAPLISNGCCTGTITMIEDVTERVVREAELQHQIEALKQTESALLSTYARLQHLLSCSPAVIYTRQLSGEGGITFVSNNITAKLGYQPQDFIDNELFWAQHIHPEDAPHVFANSILTLQHLPGGISQHKYLILEYRFLHKDGSYRWVRDEMKLVHNLEGNVLEIVGAWYDITERKRAEEQLQEQAALLDIATDAILVQDLDNRILFWNKGAERLYGWTAAETLGEKANQFLYLENLSRLRHVQKMVLQKGEWQGELHQVTKDGAEVIVESRWTLVCDERERPKSILAVNTDITQKKQLEAQFLRIQRIESIGTLAGGIAHDLNNVLTPVLTAIKLLQMELPAQKKQRLLTLIETSAKRGANLVKQVLSFARGIQGERTNIQLGHLLWDIKQIAQETFPKSIEVCLDIPNNLWPICADATQIDQVFMNLAVNARDALPYGGNITISAENFLIDEEYLKINLEAKVGSYVVVTFSDNGNGILPETLERIFEPFFTTKEVGKGTGLGLSTVIGIVKSHGGFVTVDSKVGKGATFKVYLPAVLETAEHQDTEDIEIPNGKGELILVVDDELAIRETAETTLENAGYQVLTAGEGIEAIILASQYKNLIRLALIDMMMPSMDGISLIRHLRKINPQIKIIVASGIASSEQVSEAADRGVKKFLPKPYTTQEFLKTISATLES